MDQGTGRRDGSLQLKTETWIEEFEVERLLVIKLTVRCTLFCSILNIIMSASFGASPSKTPRHATLLRGLLLRSPSASPPVHQAEVDFVVDIIESVLGEIVTKTLVE